MKWIQRLLQAWLLYRQGRAVLPTNTGLLLALILSIAVILISLWIGLSIGLALVAVWGIFTYALYRQGFAIKDLLRMSWERGKTSVVVIRILLLIGWLTAMWQASGTTPMILATSMELLHPQYFIISAFLLTSMVSLLIGTSFGTVATIGVVLITIAKAGGIPLGMAAGAIMAGAYVGDRNSPISSSAALVASLTHTTVNSNVLRMLKDSIPALAVSAVIYLLLSTFYPLSYESSYLPDTIHFLFHLHWSLWIPVALIIALLPTRLSIHWPIAMSAVAAAILAMIHQHYSINQIAQFSLFGFQLPHFNPLAEIIKGGGLLSMAMPILVIFMACSIAGMLDNTGVWTDLRRLLTNLRGRSQLYGANVILAFITGALGCSQAISVIMTHSIMRTTYAKEGIKDEDVMLDFENSGILISPLLPWNIAAFVPIVMMDVSSTGYIPFAFFLYVAPLMYWYRLKRKESL
ncbi:Na+/H+ antiporter NhaC family protein [Veillonella agrestimuris]|uniref:Na+/H+ antiporter NhaC family protein n=1 Tax=Veillonella agrestimuris TaxID=2941340 RepID=UPI00203D17C6|nr:Na+/H+ antiporter NhaC family protein [Veillonella agrestimuris]